MTNIPFPKEFRYEWSKLATETRQAIYDLDWSDPIADLWDEVLYLVGQDVSTVSMDVSERLDFSQAITEWRI